MDIEQEAETGAEALPESKTTYDVVREAIEASEMTFTNDPMEKKGPADEAAAQAIKNRDESGRFAKKEQDLADGKKVAPVQNEITAKDNPDGQIVQASNPAEAPAGWPNDAKPLWSQLPPAVQAAVLKREMEINEGGRRWSEEAQL